MVSNIMIVQSIEGPFVLKKIRKVFGGDMNELEFIKLLILWRISRGSVKVSVSIFAQIRLSSSLYPYT